MLSGAGNLVVSREKKWNGKEMKDREGSAAH